MPTWSLYYHVGGLNLRVYSVLTEVGALGVKNFLFSLLMRRIMGILFFDYILFFDIVFSD